MFIHGYFGFPYYYPYGYYPYYYPYPYAYPYPYTYAQPQVYAEPQQEYWYYCNGSQAYYPYVTSCPGGWLRVVPTPPQPGEE